MRHHRNVALAAVFAVDVSAEDFWAGDGAAVASSAVLAHEEAVRNHWRRSRMKAIGLAELLGEAAKVVFAE